MHQVVSSHPYTKFGHNSLVVEWKQLPSQIKVIEDALKSAQNTAAAKGRGLLSKDEQIKLKQQLQNEQMQEWLNYIFMLQSFI